MTPTLAGRWQTRLLLMGTLGLFLTLFLMIVFGAFRLGPTQRDFWKLLFLLGYVTLLGLALDILYIELQRFRWDHDWPMVFQFFSGLFEGIIIFILFFFNLLPGVMYGNNDWSRFLWHYVLVWQVTFWWLFGPMRILFPRWRFHGGELW